MDWILRLVIVGLAVIVIPSLAFLAVLAKDVASPDTYYAPGYGRSWYSLRLRLANPIRVFLERSPIWLLPPYGLRSTRYVNNLQVANRVVLETEDALKHSPLSLDKKALIQSQARAVPANIVDVLWRIARLSRLAEIPGYSDSSRREIHDLIGQREAAIQQSLDAFISLPISLIRVEMAHGDIEAERLLAVLGESNKRLRDLSESYEEIKSIGRL